MEGFDTQQNQRHRYPMPAGKGCDVEISGVGKVGGQVQQATTLLSTFGHFFEKLSAELND